jgi:hypothetical protein
MDSFSSQSGPSFDSTAMPVGQNDASEAYNTQPGTEIQGAVQQFVAPVVSANPVAVNQENTVLYEPPRKKASLFSFVVLFAFFGVLAFTGYLYYTRMNEQSTNDRYVRSVESIEQSIRDLQLKDDVSYHVAAGDILAKAEEGRIRWSRIVDLILQYETVNIEFVNFSSNKDQQVFVTGKANSYEHIATLVDSLNGNNRIENPFIASMTERKQQSSRSSLLVGNLERNTVGFQLNFTYKEPALSTQ